LKYFVSKELIVSAYSVVPCTILVAIYDLT
jgi:hypothetical protein